MGFRGSGACVLKSSPTIVVSSAKAVARVTFNRSDQLNRFNRQMHQELRDAIQCLKEYKVIVLTGAGHSFCAGEEMSELACPEGSPLDLGNMVEACWNPLIRQIAALPQPVIARVNGIASGPGANIALACDFVVAARSAEFIQGSLANGLSPYAGGSWTLPRLVGQARALGLALTGERVCAEQAAEWGLIWKAVDEKFLDFEVDALATKLASLAPAALSATKAMIRSSWHRNLDDALKAEGSAVRRLGFSLDFRSRLAAPPEPRAGRLATVWGPDDNNRE